MKRVNYFLLAVLMMVTFESLSRAEQDSILYKQRVIRDDKMFKNIFAKKQGILVLTIDTIKFQSDESHNSSYNFAIP